MPPEMIRLAHGNRIEEKIWPFRNWDSGRVPPRFTSVIQDEWVDGRKVISQGNAWQKLGSTSERIGGDFRVFRNNAETSSSLNLPCHFSSTSDPLANNRHGHAFARPCAIVSEVTPGGFYWPTVVPSSMSELDSLGTQAISAVNPTNPVSGLAAFLGELREGLPHMIGTATWRDRALTAKNAGGEYLNVEFGWKPLISDIRKFYKSATNADRVMTQYAKDSGKLIYRKYHFPIEYTSDVWVDPEMRFPHPQLDDFVEDLYDMGSYTGKLTITRTTEIKRWFEGTFTYYLPPVGSLDRKFSELNKVYGINITPDVLWQLTPWSWAADWFGNFGQISKNVSQSLVDGLVMPFAYMMEHITSVNEFRLEGVTYNSYPGEQSFRQTFTSEVKTRRTATPFGFGFDTDSLTSRQLAIIGALGFSRLT